MAFEIMNMFPNTLHKVLTEKDGLFHNQNYKELLELQVVLDYGRGCES